METAIVNDNLQIEVSSEIKKWLHAKEELAAFLAGDTLILKKIQVPTLSSLAELSPEEEMPLQEIVEEVHRYRKGKKSARRTRN